MVNNLIGNNGGDPLSISGEDKVFKDLNNLIPTKKEKERIVEASVPYASQHLKNNTPYLYHQYKSQKKLFNQPRNPEHLKESITHKPGQLATGGTKLGYTQQAAPIARWVNWGTYRQAPQFYFEHSFTTLDKDIFFSLQAATAEQIVMSKGTYPEK